MFEQWGGTTTDTKASNDPNERELLRARDLSSRKPQFAFIRVIRQFKQSVAPAGPKC